MKRIHAATKDNRSSHEIDPYASPEDEKAWHRALGRELREVWRTAHIYKPEDELTRAEKREIARLSRSRSKKSG
jgi:hypothetical protein